MLRNTVLGSYLDWELHGLHSIANPAASAKAGLSREACVISSFQHQAGEWSPAQES
jgi:hypothetical protein